MALLLFCLFYYFMAGLAMVIGYHRGLAHRSFHLKKWFEYMIITAGLPAGTPIQWAGNHRQHHATMDVEGDPHSPVTDGFWYAHNGWYINTHNTLLCFLYAIAGPLRMLIDSILRPRTNQQYNHLAKDIAADRYFTFISKPLPYMLIVWLHIIIPFGIAYWQWGLAGIVSLWVTLVIIYNLGDGIDSIVHLYGEQPYNKKDHARNNKLMAFLTMGDGWLADHHQFPGSAKLGFKKGRIDISWLILKCLEYCNIASDLNATSEEVVKRSLKSSSL